jgi:single-stranded DNA-binding protein
MRDEHGSVQVICWNEAAEHFSELVKEGQMVIVDGASVKVLASAEYS